MFFAYNTAEHWNALQHADAARLATTSSETRTPQNNTELFVLRGDEIHSNVWWLDEVHVQLLKSHNFFFG
jgi:hypothetical protein